MSSSRPKKSPVQSTVKGVHITHNNNNKCRCIIDLRDIDIAVCVKRNGIINSYLWCCDECSNNDIDTHIIGTHYTTTIENNKVRLYFTCEQCNANIPIVFEKDDEGNEIWMLCSQVNCDQRSDILFTGKH